MMPNVQEDLYVLGIPGYEAPKPPLRHSAAEPQPNISRKGAKEPR